jgi:hypothetical protein
MTEIGNKCRHSAFVWKSEHRYDEWLERLRRRLPLKHCTKTALSKLHWKCSDRVRIFHGPNNHLIYRQNFIEPNLAKVGVEGSNPFARSNDFNDLGDIAFVAQSVATACVFISVLIRTPAQKSWKFNV